MTLDAALLSTPERARPSLLRIAVALSFDFVVGLVTHGLPNMAIPAELALLSEYAAEINSAISAVFLVAGYFTPFVGYSIDRLGTDRPHKVFVAVTMTTGCILVLVAVRLAHEESAASSPSLPPPSPAMPLPPSVPPPSTSAAQTPLVLYVIGMLMILVPCISVAGVVYAAVTGGFILQRPERASTISALANGYVLLGMTAGTYLAGNLFPIAPHAHSFYWLLLAIVLVNVLVMLLVPTDFSSADHLSAGSDGNTTAGLAPAPDSLADGAEQPPAASTSTNGPPLPSAAASGSADAGSAGTRTSWAAVARTYACGRQYRPFRLVVLAQTIFRAASALGEQDGLYYVQDVLGFRGTRSQALLGTLGLASAVAGVLVALVAAPFCDRFGVVPCVVCSTLLMGAVTAATPFLGRPDHPDALLPTLVLPLNGVAQVLYGVTDFALIVTTLPDLRRRARDIGVFNAAGAAGPFLMSIANGCVLAAVGGTYEHGDGQRPTYPLRAYLLLYLPTAALVSVSSTLICCADRSMRQRKRVLLEGHGHAPSGSARGWCERPEGVHHRRES